MSLFVKFASELNNNIVGVAGKFAKNRSRLNKRDRDIRFFPLHGVALKLDLKSLQIRMRV